MSRGKDVGREGCREGEERHGHTGNDSEFRKLEAYLGEQVEEGL